MNNWGGAGGGGGGLGGINSLPSYLCTPPICLVP